MKKLLLPLITLVSVFAISCSDDRVTPDEYKSLNDFYERNREQTQTYTIETDEGGPIVGKKGSEIYGSRHQLQHANGDSVQLPWAVTLIELYTVKDHLLYQQPTLENNVTPIESEGTIKVLAYAKQEELQVRSDQAFITRLSTSPAKTGMNLYSGGTTPDTFINWAAASDGSSLGTADGKHQLSLKNLGWHQVAGSTFGSTTTVTFTLEGTGAENIDIWGVPSSKTALFYGTNLSLPNVPVGETLTILALALNQDDNLVMYKQDVTITDGLVIALEMKETSESDVLSFIEGL